MQIAGRSLGNYSLLRMRFANDRKKRRLAPSISGLF
jgi:hypothetical protein